jgi:uncharacterized repeat protein (TIGR01451 family)
MTSMLTTTTPTNKVHASASATVNLTNALASIRLVKTANPSVNEPGGNVTYSFTVYNDSAVDSVTITSLTDTVYGDLTNLTKPR